MESRRAYQAGLEARRRGQRRRTLLWWLIGVGVAGIAVLVALLILGF
jgi:hypothetical protein